MTKRHAESALAENKMMMLTSTEREIMDVFEAIRNRRSVRSYTKEPVKDEDLRKMIEYATYAPSAGNLQPWVFIVVKNNETKKKLAVAAYHQIFISRAPVVIVVCANVERTKRYYGERGEKLYVIQDTAAAIQNLLLVAHALGYGSCWVGAFNEEAVRKILSIPKHIRPVAIIPIGKPAYNPRMPPRIPAESVTFYEKYGMKEKSL